MGGQGELEFVEQELELRLGLCVAGEAQFAPIGRWQINVDHLHGREFLEHAARGEAWRERLQLLAERDVQAVGEEGDKDCALRCAAVPGGTPAGWPDRL